MMTDSNEEIRQFLESIPDTFRIMETGVDIQTQKEYLDYSESLDRGDLTEEQTCQLASILYLPDATEISKKKILTLLAHALLLLQQFPLQTFRAANTDPVKTLRTE